MKRTLLDGRGESVDPGAAAPPPFLSAEGVDGPALAESNVLFRDADGPSSCVSALAASIESDLRACSCPPRLGVPRCW